MSPRRPTGPGSGGRDHLRVVPDWVREEREPSHRKPAARGPGARRGFGTTWWGRAWVQALEQRGQLDPNRLPRGRAYARSGAVTRPELSPGLIRAQVQGSRREPYEVTVRVRTFADPEWDRLLDAVAAQVGHAAALLDGELAPEVIDDVAAAGLSLLPGPGELQPRCTCPDWADPCKHAAAACYQVADVLDTDPFALLRLRGRDRDEVLAALRRRRLGTAAGDDVGVGADGTDHGTPARAAFLAADSRPPLPAPPLPPSHPGRPAALATDPPIGSVVSTRSLAGLAADAAVRAHALLTGDDVTATALDLDVDSDVVRRVAARTASAADVSRRLLPWTREEVERRAHAWQVGGRSGLHAYLWSWSPEPDLLVAGMEALGAGARRRANRVTHGDVQLRLDAEGRWHPFVRAHGEWQLAGPGVDDPSAAVAALTSGPAAGAE